MKTNNQEIDGLPFRYVTQIVRRKMITKVHGDKSKYNRKNKTWKAKLFQE